MFECVAFTRCIDPISYQSVLKLNSLSLAAIDRRFSINIIHIYSTGVAINRGLVFEWWNERWWCDRDDDDDDDKIDDGEKPVLRTPEDLVLGNRWA